jgi:hypothetical protein
MKAHANARARHLITDPYPLGDTIMAAAKSTKLAKPYIQERKMQLPFEK